MPTPPVPGRAHPRARAVPAPPPAATPPHLANLEEALAYDASPDGDLPCLDWCSKLRHSGCCGMDCDCGMERARAVITTLQAAVAGKEPPMT